MKVGHLLVRWMQTSHAAVLRSLEGRQEPPGFSAAVYVYMA
jgi:hypothetical protein